MSFFLFLLFFLLQCIQLSTPCRVLSAPARLCGIKLLVGFCDFTFVLMFYCIPTALFFYSMFLFHRFIVNLICKPYSSQGAIKIELNCTESFREEWRVVVYWLITGNNGSINEEVCNITENNLTTRSI